jgi:hypothetical protein
VFFDDEPKLVAADLKSLIKKGRELELQAGYK